MESIGIMLPSEVSKAYNFPQGRSLEQQCVAIVELGGGYSSPTIFSYCDKNGYQHPELYNEFVDGALDFMTGPSGADGEVCLDICVIAGVAQGVKILTIFAPNSEQGFADAINAAVNHELKPCAISISWGAPVVGAWTDQGRALVDAALQNAKNAGIMVFAASGDNGANDGTDNPVVDYPSASPYSIGCGGTRLELNADGSRKAEKAWTLEDGNGSTGGGTTNLYGKPSFQVGHGLPGRNVPDIAGNADPVTGYDVFADGLPMVVGGTSAVAPLYAALCALITSRLGKPVSNWLDVIYSYPGVVVDVVGGDNGAYRCVEGFDCCTGMGAVDGEKLLAALAETNNITVLPAVKANPQPTLPEFPSLSVWKKLWNGFLKLTGHRKPAHFARRHTTVKR